MKINNRAIVLDFETYYSSTYSLRKMTTTEYIMSPEFKVHGVAVGFIADGSLVDRAWHTGADMVKFFGSVDWPTMTVIGHNLMFDGSILGLRLGIKPKRYIDTLGMSRSVYGATIKSHALQNVYAHITGKQGKTLSKALTDVCGAADLTPEQMHILGSYALDDVYETYVVFDTLAKMFPRTEYNTMDHVIRMHTEPVLMLDTDYLQGFIAKCDSEKEDHEIALEKLGHSMADVSSNPKCAALLKSYGVPDSDLIMQKTGKVSMSKANPSFMRLQESDDIALSTIVSARINAKSTIKKSRATALLNIAKATGGIFPVPLVYCGAMQTNRFSGKDVNVQNFPRGKGLRNAIIAPKGYVIVVADLSNIELRTNMVMCSQLDKVADIRAGKDLYCDFASILYGQTVTKADKLQRQIGKTGVLSLGYRSGHKAFRSMLFTQAGILESEDFCKKTVTLYRSNNYMVTSMWTTLDMYLGKICAKMYHGLGSEIAAPFTWYSDAVVTPLGFTIKYHDLKHYVASGHGTHMTHLCHTKYNAARGGREDIHGGSVIAWLNQSIARDVIIDVAARVFRDTGYRMAMQVHDELVYVAPESQAEDLLGVLLGHMKQPPIWWPELPVDGAGGIAYSYGDAK